MRRKLFVGLVGIVICIFAYQKYFSFDAQKILNQSVLKERTFSGRAVEVKALNDKVTAYLMEEHSLPLVSVSFGFDKAGSAYEPKIGVAVLTESSLLDGAGRHSRKELRDIMKEKGIKIDVNATGDRLAFSFSYVKTFEKDAIDVLKAILYEPKLDAGELETTKRQLVAVRQSKLENPQYHLGRLVERQFYGEHPYGREDIPEEKILALVSAADIRSYLKQVMGKDNLKVGIAGDINEEETKNFLNDVFSGLQDKAQITEISDFQPDFSSADETIDIPFSAQSFVLFLGQGIKRLNPDFYPLYIANYYFGGAGLNSRLSEAVREKEGLTYGIYSYFTNSDAVDLWQVYFSATPDKANQAVKIIKNEYQKFYEQGISQKELDFVKQALLSSYHLRFSKLSTIAEMLEQMQVQNLGIDFLEKRQGYVEAVTLEEVNQAIRRHMPKSLDLKGKVRRFEAEGKIK